MKLLHWTVFVDLLGYQELNGGVKSLDDAKDLIEFMDSNQQIFNDQTQNVQLRKQYENSSYNLYEHYEISFAFISDSLIISYTPNLDKDFPEEIALRHSANSLLIILQRLRLLIYKCAHEKNIFLRGGISNDYSYIHGNFAVGKGVGSAYKAETLAKYPRVILAKDVTANTKLMKAIDDLSKIMYSADLIKDDGEKYLDFNCFGRVTLDAKSNNPFVIKNAISNPEKYKETVLHEGGMLRGYKEAIEFQIRKALMLKDSINPEEQGLYKSLKEKYIWLSNYHDKSCEEFSRLTIAIPKPIAYENPKILEIVYFLLKVIPVIVALKIDNELLNALKN
jgi:hypothetical protein